MYVKVAYDSFDNKDMMMIMMLISAIEIFLFTYLLNNN